MDDKKFLHWIYKRMAGLYEEPPNLDFMIRLKAIVDAYKPGVSTRTAFSPKGIAEKMVPHNCLTCMHEPEWQITRYGTDGYSLKSGFCRCPMPFTDHRSAIQYDTEWNDGLDEQCPAWGVK